MSKTLDEIRALLTKHGVTIGDLRRPVAKGGAGLGPYVARKLLGLDAGEVSIASAEKALALIRRELTTKKSPKPRA